MMDLAVLLFVFLVVCSIFPTGAWLYFSKRADALWPPRRTGTQLVSSGQYREGVAPTFSDKGPPKEVLVAAIGSWVLGQMFLPGLALGLFGLIIVVGVVSIPGLILAWQLFFLGKPLMLGLPEAAPKARSAATFARVLNAIVVIVTLIGMAMSTFGGGGLRSRGAWDALALGGPILLYALMSLVHARYLDRAADAIDAHNASPVVTTGVRVEAHEAIAAMADNEQADRHAVADEDAAHRGQRS